MKGGGLLSKKWQMPLNAGEQFNRFVYPSRTLGITAAFMDNITSTVKSSAITENAVPFFFFFDRRTHTVTITDLNTPIKKKYLYFFF